MFCEEVVIFRPRNVFTLIDEKKIPFNPWFNWLFLFGTYGFKAIKNQPNVKFCKEPFSFRPMSIVL